MDMIQSTGSFRVNYPSVLRAAAVSGALAVILGAFGAHALEGQLSLKRAATYETASQYHFYHTLLLVGLALMPRGKWVRYAQIACGWGLVIFCGTLYVLATRGLIGLESAGWLGAITPIGGVGFILAWGLMAVAAVGRS